MKRILTRERRVTYVRWLRSLGIQELGRGFNSHVFQHPELEDIAVKVVDAGDRVYLKYMRWAAKNQHNPYVPQIIDWIQIDVINHHGYVIVFMEKLDEIDKVEYDELLDELECEDDIHREDLESARESVSNDSLRTLLNFLLTRPSSLDLHQANFMKRGKQVVFIDPFAGG